MDDSATSRVKSNGVEDDDDGLTGDEETKLLGDGETRYCQGGLKPVLNAQTTLTYEESLLVIDVGRFHVLLLLLCGWAVSSDAIEVLSVSFLLPSATCDLHLSSQDKGWLNAIVFVGMMFGGLFWGSLADHSGRRAVLMWSLAMNGIGGLLSSISQVFWLFLLMRFISGVGVGGSMPVIFTYFTEFQAKTRRGSMISVLATFWMGGNILAAGLAWLVIPHSGLGYFSTNFTFNSWRIFIALCTIPSLSSAILFLFMPESPKFLLQAGKEEKALDVLKRVHCINKSDNPFDISRLLLSSDHKTGKSVILEESVEVSQPEGCCHFSGMLNSSVELFRPPLRFVTCILLIVNFAIAFGYYGLFMWFPEIFNRIDKNGGTLCEPGSGSTNTNTSSNSTHIDCTQPGNIVYLEGFLTAVSNLPGNLLTIVLMDRIGRRILLCMCSQHHLRSTAFGIQTGIARIAAILGNIIFGVLVDVHCAVPMILVAALMSFGGLMSVQLPNTKGIDIH
ncbi:hypothetical protein C0Q70_03547 [Pomacea canaliculata]|uniref:Major facilitator superfamily (MFS) profile domain-containing protein n=1 Tax=Pomacea canaliculata TaxID=400727 RepID=A0A2T7PT07_POMCA|nr:hypothetical protein C0Q70_03547 [Pomacea canaliculata]